LRARSLPVRVVDGSAERLGLPDAEFDLIYSVDVIHHVRDRTAAFREAFRVLRSGGATCVVTDSEWMIRNRTQSLYFPETIDVELARYPAIATLRAELTHAGFGALREQIVEHAYEITDAAAYRAKVFSSLLYIDEQAFERGLARLESDLLRGPVRATSRYMMLWALKPADRNAV
jgi:ubiquinone/menaquinone biosynthesis C-methylase UbiE